MNEGRDDACSGGADRMPERASAAIHVDLRVIELEIVHRGHGDARERFVDLVEIDLIGSPADFRQQGFQSADRRCGEPFGRLRVACIADDAGERFQVVARRECTADDDGRRCAVGDRGRARGGDRAVFVEGRFQVRDFRDVAREGRFILIDDALALAVLHRNRRDLALERLTLNCRHCALHGFCGERVLLLAGEVVFLRRLIGEMSHQLAVERALQTVEEHVVDDFAVTHAIAAARLRQ